MRAPKLHQRAGRLAMTGLAGGIVASLAMNLQAINLGQDEPGVGAYVSAVIWPSALFVVIEIMLHTPWRFSARDALTKWAGLLAVAGMSAWISYWHGVHVLAAFHYDTESAHFGPIAVDLTMTMSALALNRVGQARRVETPAVAETREISETPVAEMNTASAETDGNLWDRIAAETAGMDAPSSPAPAGAESHEISESEAVETPKMRTPRGEISPALKDVVSGLINGETPAPRDGASKATIARYARVWRTLRNDPRAEIDPAILKGIRPELFAEMRAAVTVEMRPYA